MSEDMVNRQHLAAMGVDPDSLGGTYDTTAKGAMSEEGRCVSVHPVHQDHRCVRKSGHDGRHVRGAELWVEETLALAAPTKQREGDQRLPSGGLDCVQDLIIAEMEESKRVGTQRYGQPLMTFNGRKGFQDVAEEVRDLHVYLAMVQREAEATREILVQVASEALREFIFPGEAKDFGETFPMAEIAVDAIMGWVVGQRMSQVQALGSGEDIYRLLDEGAGVAVRPEVIEAQTHAVMDRLGIEMEES